MEEVPLAVEEAPDFLNRVQLEGEEYKELVALEDLDRIINEVCPLLTQTPNETSLRAAFDSVSAMDGEELAEKVGSWGEVLRSLTRERTQLQEYRWWRARRRDIAREHPVPPGTLLDLESPAIHGRRWSGSA